MGRFELELTDDLLSAVLHYRTGILEITTAVGVLQIQQCQHHGQLLVNDPAKLITGIVSRPSWQWVGHVLQHVDFTPPALRTDPDGWFQAVPEEPGFTAAAQPTATGLAISLELGQTVPAPADWDHEMQLNAAFWDDFWTDTRRSTFPIRS